MREETLTPTMREAVHFASGHNTPQVVEALLSKCALFNPPRTAMLHANERFGAVWKQHGEAILAKVREKEKVPDAIDAVVVSLDGVRHRPMENPSEETPATYQNAMVGTARFSSVAWLWWITGTRPSTWRRRRKRPMVAPPTNQA